jgi:hypothetical protein
MGRFQQIIVNASLALAVAACSTLRDPNLPEYVPGSGGCGIGPGAPPVQRPIHTRDEAIAAALTAPGLRQPIEVTDVVHGRLEDVYAGVHPSFVDEERAAAFQRSMQRDAWAVHLTAGIGSTCDATVTTIDRSAVQIVLDSLSGVEMSVAWTEEN